MGVKIAKPGKEFCLFIGGDYHGEWVQVRTWMDYHHVQEKQYTAITDWDGMSVLNFLPKIDAYRRAVACKPEQSKSYPIFISHSLSDAEATTILIQEFS